MANYRLVAATTDSGDSLPRQMANVHCLDIDTPVHEDQSTLQRQICSMHMVLYGGVSARVRTFRKRVT